MITFQEETYESMTQYPNFKNLLKLNWNETEVLKITRKLRPKFEMYKTLEDNKMLDLYSVKDKETLVGYFIGVVTPHQHFEDTMVAQTDTFFIQKEYRQGLCGYRFLKYVIKKLKSKVDLIFLTTNVERDLSKVMARLGFKLADYKFVLEV